MNDIHSLKSQLVLMNAKRLAFFLLAVCILSLAGCGSTKVYTTQKSVTYKGDLYNVSNIQKIGTRVDGLTPDGSVINMKGMDKKAAQAQLDEHSPLVVSTVFEMDSQEMIYQRKSITKSSEFSTMVKNFEGAGNKISKFMANKKSTQLKLK